MYTHTHTHNHTDIQYIHTDIYTHAHKHINRHAHTHTHRPFPVKPAEMDGSGSEVMIHCGLVNSISSLGVTMKKSSQRITALHGGTEHFILIYSQITLTTCWP